MSISNNFTGGNNANNVQSLAAEGVVERGRFVMSYTLFAYCHVNIVFLIMCI